MSDELEGGDFTAFEGRDGWLFLGSYDGTNAMSLFTDPDAMLSEVYEAWRDTLRRRREYFDGRGTAYLTLVVPDAYVVYPDKLPVGTELLEQTPYRQLEKLLDPATLDQNLYLLDALTAGRATTDTFQTKDSHWNDWGAFLGYQATVDALTPRVPNIGRLTEDRLEWSTRKSFGALGVVMEPEQSETLRVAKVVDSLCQTTKAITTEVRDGYMVVEQDRPELPTAVIFRDSFMTNAHKFFSESFRRTVYVSHPNRMFFDLLEQENPDVVIFQSVERRLSIAPQEPSIFDFRMMFGDLLLENGEAIVAQLTSRSLLRNGDAAEALAANDVALGLAPPTARLMLHRSRVFAQLGQPGAALESLRTATTLDPSDGPVHFILGQALRERGLVAEALAAGRRAVELQPDYAILWPFAITSAIEANDHRAALDLAEQGLAIHPGNPDVLYAQSRAFAAAGDLQQAESTVREAVSASPDSVLYLGQLASVLIRRTDWPAAAACLTDLQALDGDPSPALMSYVSLVERELERSRS